MSYKLVHISTIRHGDVVIHGEKERTVGKKDVSHGGFMGSSIFGDCYRLGQVPVKKVVFCERVSQ